MHRLLARASRFFSRFHHRIANHLPLLFAELLLHVAHLFLKAVHSEITHVEMKIRIPPMPAATEFCALRHVFPGELDWDFLLLTFAQNRERDVCSIRETAD